MGEISLIEESEEANITKLREEEDIDYRETKSFPPQNLFWFSLLS